MTGSDPAAKTASYGRGASLLSLGFAATGILSFAYFSAASYALDGDAYKRVVLLWSLTFIGAGIIYRPMEQLIARGIGADRASADAHVRTAVTLQAGLALAFLALALAFREPITEDLFDGSDTLYWVLVGSVLAFPVSYAARGWLAGHGRFGAYGALITLEAAARLGFAVAVVAGAGGGEDAVALGILAAPVVSLVVVPIAASRRRRDREPVEAPPETGGLAAGGTFALGALAVLLAEQTLLNAGVLVVELQSSDDALAGHVFNALLIARAPLLMFMAVQSSLLPHLAGLEDDAEAFGHAVRVTLAATIGFGVAVALGLLAVGPPFMDAFFGGDYDYGRGGLALIGLAVGIHLAASTLTQAALARSRAGVGALWLVAATVFTAFVVFADVDDLLLRVEIGYALAATLLLGLVYGFFGRGHASAPGAHPPAA